MSEIGLIQEGTDSSFAQDVLESPTLVLVDFWAKWCGPCRMIAPILEEVAAEMKSQIKIVKIDIDSNPSTPTEFNVRSIPALLLFKDGKVVANQAGAMSKVKMIEWIKNFIS